MFASAITKQWRIQGPGPWQAKNSVLFKWADWESCSIAIGRFFINPDEQVKPGLKGHPATGNFEASWPHDRPKNICTLKASWVGVRPWQVKLHVERGFPSPSPSTSPSPSPPLLDRLLLQIQRQAEDFVCGQDRCQPQVLMPDEKFYAFLSVSGTGQLCLHGNCEGLTRRRRVL